MDVKTVAVLAICCLAIATVRVCKGCSMPVGWRPFSDTEEVLVSRVVLYGRVIKTHIDNRFNYGSGSTAYTAEFQVYCGLKGPAPTSRVVNITEAGHIPGHCISTDLAVNKEYFVLGSQHDGVYRITRGEIEATKTNIVNVYKACGLRVQYPPGAKPADAKECPAPTPPTECHDRKHYNLTQDTNDPDAFYDDSDSGAGNLSIAIYLLALNFTLFKLITNISL